ncbi:hypothetical protein T265_02243 [Opisthorchis viverrini]|uniref:Uncharacterized protein n=1 Tax=Opisthorchis viverrini TaxID=6198 RepID=A0A074ZVX4_OPIVI|nr:hypothetical protein T265_02243 [Opisthorchis viverrini]KER31608.1 hypothetical protein T265_02243 [Opisthorchis viverrini]
MRIEGWANFDLESLPVISSMARRQLFSLIRSIYALVFSGPTMRIASPGIKTDGNKRRTSESLRGRANPDRYAHVRLPVTALGVSRGLVETAGSLETACSDFGLLSTVNAEYASSCKREMGVRRTGGKAPSGRKGRAFAERRISRSLAEGNETRARTEPGVLVALLSPGANVAIVTSEAERPGAPRKRTISALLVSGGKSATSRHPSAWCGGVTG